MAAVGLLALRVLHCKIKMLFNPVVVVVVCLVVEYDGCFECQMMKHS